MAKRLPLSGLIAKGYMKHTHEWGQTTRVWEGKTFYFDVCLNHQKDGKVDPFIKAYHLEALAAK